MKIKFNKGYQFIDKVKFPDCKISIMNTTEEIKEYCPNNQYITDFNGGTITSHHGEYMFCNDSKLSSFTTNLNGIMYGDSMFQNCVSLSSIATNLTQLRRSSENVSFYDEATAKGMFANCTNLSSVDLGKLEYLENGSMMFLSCVSLQSFSGSLENLVYADGMFYNCSKLESVDIGSLSSLTNAKSMFSKTKIKSFSADTVNLKDAKYMFSNCSNMVSCSTVFNNVSNCNGAFENCSNLRYLSLGNIDCDINLSACPLTVSSLSAIAENAVSGTHKIICSEHDKSLASFSKIQKIFEGKGWIVS